MPSEADRIETTVVCALTLGVRSCTIPLVETAPGSELSARAGHAPRVKAQWS
jgi:hypothetical protein